MNFVTTGSEKQIAWANRIVLPYLDRIETDYPQLLNQSKAAFWIDNREVPIHCLGLWAQKTADPTIETEYLERRFNRTVKVQNAKGDWEVTSLNPTTGYYFVKIAPSGKALFNTYKKHNGKLFLCSSFNPVSMKISTEEGLTQYTPENWKIEKLGQKMPGGWASKEIDLAFQLLLPAESSRSEVSVFPIYRNNAA